MNEAEYLMNNYGDRGGCYHTLRDLQNSSYDMKPNSIIVLLFIQIIPSLKTQLKTWLPPSMLSSSSIVHVQGCSAPQIFSKQQMSPFKLSSCCSCHARFQLLFRLVLTLETSEMSAIFVFTTKTTQLRLQVFSVNGALTYKDAALLTSPVD